MLITFHKSRLLFQNLFFFFNFNIGFKIHHFGLWYENIVRIEFILVVFLYYLVQIIQWHHIFALEEIEWIVRKVFIRYFILDL